MDRRIFLVVLFFLGSIACLSAQNIDWRIKEVYGSYLNELMTVDPQRIELLTDLLDNRITYLNSKETADEKYIKISTLPILNKYNPTLSHTPGFEEKKFNPIKYSFNFFNPTTLIYRIDGTDYLLVVAAFKPGSR